jgi:heptosyltransferase III
MRAAVSERILVIRRDNIGDLVCTTPLFEALRRRRPGAHIAALVNDYNAGVLAGNPHLDAVHVYTKTKHRAPGASWWGTLLASHRLLTTLRSPAFDHVILAKSGFDPHGLGLARRMRPRSIIGFAPTGGGEAKGISVALPPPANDELHETEAILQLGAPLGVEGPPGPLRVYPDAARVAQWRARFPAGRKHWVGLHISARIAGRVWPVEKFVALAQTLSGDPALGIVLLWSPGAASDPRHPGDDERAAAIATRLGPGATLVPAKTESLADLIAVLSLCHSFIGPDGGAMHLAAASGLPVVALIENLPYKKRHWHPWKVPHEMVSPQTGNAADVAGIPAAAVEAAWNALAGRAQ